MPDLVFVPYLLTGDRYYAEEMAFWANHGMLATNGHGVDGLLKGNEVRGVGWVMRNMAEAAAYYPDGSPVKAYLAEGRQQSELARWLREEPEDAEQSALDGLCVDEVQPVPKARSISPTGRTTISPTASIAR